jgi:hypothetical protein
VKTKTFGSFKDMLKTLEADLKAKDRAVRRAAQKAAERGAAVVQNNVPEGHKELRASVHADGSTIVVDGPHAAAVEVGARPHTVPLEALLEWAESKVGAGPRARALAISVQKKIAAKGVAPTWFARRSLPEIEALLGELIPRALEE